MESRFSVVWVTDIFRGKNFVRHEMNDISASAVEIFLIDSGYDAKQTELKDITRHKKAKFNQSCESGAEIIVTKLQTAVGLRQTKASQWMKAFSIPASAGAASESNTYFTSS